MSTTPDFSAEAVRGFLDERIADVEAAMQSMRLALSHLADVDEYLKQWRAVVGKVE